MSTTSQILLGLNCTEYGRHSGGWMHPESDVSQMPNIGVYEHLARTAERGFMDQLFVADSPVHNRGRLSIGPTRMDPMALALLMAKVTEHIGVIATITTSYNEPYDIARRAAALSVLTQGRSGINFVASTGDAIARNYDLPGQLDHDARYARYEEFITAVTRLWASSAQEGTAATAVHVAGEHVTLDTALDVPRAPLGRPLIVMAGSSPESRDQAARWADAVYAAGRPLDGAQEFYADIKRRAEAYGRDPDSIKVMLGLTAYIGDTVEEAASLEATLDGLHARGADTIGYLSGVLELDLSTYDPDGPVPFDDLPTAVSSASVSQSALLTRMAREQGLSIREVAFRAYAGGLSNMQFREAMTPPQMADVMERLVRGRHLRRLHDRRADRAPHHRRLRGRRRPAAPAAGARPHAVGAAAHHARLAARPHRAGPAHLTHHRPHHREHPRAEPRMIVATFLTLTGDTTLEQVVGTSQRLEQAGASSVGLLDGADTGLGPTPFESTTLAARVAAVTSTIGVVATDSALYGFPYHSARRLATLDHLAAGRSGWLLRHSTGAEEAAAYEWRSTLGRADELHRANEYVEIGLELWDSWEDGAQWPDKESGDFKDDSRIHPINYRSTSFRVAGPLDTPPSPQQRPVIFAQVGTLEEARYLTVSADVVVLAPEAGTDLAELAGTVRAAAEAAGSPVTLLVAGEVDGLLGLATAADATAAVAAIGADGVALHGAPAAGDALVAALDGLGLAPVSEPGTLAAALGIELPVGGRAA
ncbi:LLM class flavin-dependent oxidoreductase [Nocardioides bruguierae]|uniref:LLM class flavin-dependent oxidoreductase n=1 Tax=Nocardioides bruguierae TaxID=2945102 RepID=A0A9X2D850_9ACTN|nr:LLM class flavin-dependent oxidoreductase [Nocardioides bruguierae]MCM0621133.1 LLM class flavin-dependent oxidoreductase [Nocardioides bruguierae]